MKIIASAYCTNEDKRGRSSAGFAHYYTCTVTNAQGLWEPVSWVNTFICQVSDQTHTAMNDELNCKPVADGHKGRLSIGCVCCRDRTTHSETQPLAIRCPCLSDKHKEVQNHANQHLYTVAIMHQIRRKYSHIEMHSCCSAPLPLHWHNCLASGTAAARRWATGRVPPCLHDISTYQWLSSR